MSSTIPQQSNKKYSQINNGDFSDNIRQTKNISFDNDGYITLEKRTRMLYDSSVYTAFRNSINEPIQKMVYAELSTRTIWIMGTNALYYLDTNFAPVQDVTSGTPGLFSNSGDMIYWQNAGSPALFVANFSTLSYYNGTAWATISTDITFPDTLAIFDSANCLVVAGQNKVQLVDTTFTKGNLLTLPTQYRVISMDWANGILYIGTLEINDGEAMVFTWDGVATQWINQYPVRARQVMAVKRYDTTSVAIVTSIGQLFRLTNTLQELGNFPIYYTQKDWIGSANVSRWSMKVMNGGIVVDRNKIFIAVQATYSTPTDSTQDPYFKNDFPSGVWCYDPGVGLHHKYSVDSSTRTISGAVTTSNVNTSTGVITVPSSIVPDTGTPVFYDDGSFGAGTMIGGLLFNTRYFVIKLSGTTFKLATTYANAILTTPSITLTSTGNNSQTFIFCPNNGFGGINQTPTSLLKIFNKSTTGGLLHENSKAEQFLIGSVITKDYGTTNYAAIHAVETKQENRGYYIYPRIPSSQITDIYQKVILKFKPLVNAEDAIIVKYRSINPNISLNKLYTTLPTGTGTWVTNTTFTVTSITELVVGYEIEIVNGAGSGYLAHITAISTINGGVYTITIDETVQNITIAQTFLFTVDTWKKCQSIITISSVLNSHGLAEIAFPDMSKSTDIEVRVEIRGMGVMIEEGQIINKKDQPSL